MQITQYDIVICGAGPAGNTCALTLVDAGLKVLVIEKSNFPREKTCGDGLAAYIPKVLDRINPIYGNAFRVWPNKRPIDAFSIQVGAKSLVGQFPEPWFCSSRFDFDHFLYDLAKGTGKIDYLLATKVEKVEDLGDLKSVVTSNGTFHTRLVIGCDGAQSVVRRSLTDYKTDANYNYAAIRAYYKGLTHVLPNSFGIYLSPLLKSGYFWIFPANDGMYNVGLGGLGKEVIEKKVNLKLLLEEVIQSTPELRTIFKDAVKVNDFQGGGIPYGFERFPLSGNGFLLCGDAASLADPLTGEGIGIAMVAGRIAGYQAIACFKANDFSAKFCKGYDKAIEKKFGPLLRRRQRIANFVINNPKLIPPLFYVLTLPMRLYVRMSKIIFLAKTT